ncbi:hypothetical protein W97_07534 [Coniosporium apollinis CBS 100218]|uniref:Uncharacterized protein n=1 Tax=Coniosporium apollinis (strain CBS 100218) TaxID=1168221 RepID=R7Z2X5_CONA1|nr:uncharacterized protein W97_07534 [Coniosporium apollinis CBS 100218]EON68276.1 hypothetical protein W97_07534 [Coniosporium apollinis CBS 100218]
MSNFRQANVGEAASHEQTNYYAGLHIENSEEEDSANELLEETAGETADDWEESDDEVNSQAGEEILPWSRNRPRRRRTDTAIQRKYMGKCLTCEQRGHKWRACQSLCTHHLRIMDERIRHNGQECPLKGRLYKKHGVSDALLAQFETSAIARAALEREELRPRIVLVREEEVERAYQEGSMAGWEDALQEGEARRQRSSEAQRAPPRNTSPIELPTQEPEYSGHDRRARPPQELEYPHYEMSGGHPPQEPEYQHYYREPRSPQEPEYPRYDWETRVWREGRMHGREEALPRVIAHTQQPVYQEYGRRPYTPREPEHQDYQPRIRLPAREAENQVYGMASRRSPAPRRRDDSYDRSSFHYSPPLRQEYEGYGRSTRPRSPLRREYGGVYVTINPRSPPRREYDSRGRDEYDYERSIRPVRPRSPRQPDYDSYERPRRRDETGRHPEPGYGYGYGHFPYPYSPWYPSYPPPPPHWGYPPPYPSPSYSDRRTPPEDRDRRRQ